MLQMSFPNIVIIMLSGLTSAAILFLVSTGIQLVFGALRIVNVAHGSFYMYAAFIMAAILAVIPNADGAGFWISLVVVPVGVGVLGAVIEMSLLRRIYQKEHLAQLLVTFAVFFIMADLARQIWGNHYRIAEMPTFLSGSVLILGRHFPAYSLFVMGVAIIAAICLFALLKLTMFGWRIQAAVNDPELLACTGTNVRRLFTIVFGIGVGMAGLAGAIVAPMQAIDFGMDANTLVAAFIVSIVGGLGSIAGAAIGAIIIGLFQAFGVIWFPQWSSAFIFIIMILLLGFRPEGLLGRA